MSDDQPARLDVASLESEYAEFAGVVTAIRAAIKEHTTAYAIRENKPVSPGLLMSALLGEAANVCTLWGLTRQLRPDDIEDVFNQALRNARRVLRGNIVNAMNEAADDPTKN
jgi:hypothetical protein